MIDPSAISWTVLADTFHFPLLFRQQPLYFELGPHSATDGKWETEQQHFFFFLPPPTPFSKFSHLGHDEWNLPIPRTRLVFIFTRALTASAVSSRRVDDNNNNPVNSSWKEVCVAFWNQSRCCCCCSRSGPSSKDENVVTIQEMPWNGQIYGLVLLLLLQQCTMKECFSLSLHHHFCIAAAAVRFTQDLLKFMSIQDRLAVAGYCLVAITIKVLRLSLSLMLYDMHTSNCGCFVLLHYSIIFRRGSYNGRPLTALTARAYRVNGTGKYFLTLGGMCLFLIPLYECHTWIFLSCFNVKQLSI